MYISSLLKQTISTIVETMYENTKPQLCKPNKKNKKMHRFNVNMLKSDCFSLHSANYMAVYIIYFWALCLELVWIEKACCHTDWYGWKSVPRSRDIRPECINLSVSKKVCTSELNMLEHYCPLKSGQLKIK